MKTTMYALFLLSMTACTGKVEGPSGDGLAVDDVTFGGCGSSEGRREAGPDSSDTNEPESLTVTAAGAGAIAVSHHNFLDECCVEHRIKTEVDGTTLTITYPTRGGPCDCRCSYDFDFTVTGLDAGTWTVNAGGSSASVVVE